MLHAGNHGPTPSTIFVPLTDGTRFTIRDTYSETQSKAVIVRRASTFLIRASSHPTIRPSLSHPVSRWSLPSGCCLRSLCVPSLVISRNSYLTSPRCAFDRCPRSIRERSRARKCLCGRTSLSTLCPCYSVTSYKVSFSVCTHTPAAYTFVECHY